MTDIITTGDLSKPFANSITPDAMTVYVARWRKKGYLMGDMHAGGRGRVHWEPWVPRMLRFLLTEAKTEIPGRANDRHEVYLQMAQWLHDDPTIEWFVVQSKIVLPVSSPEEALELASGTLQQFIYLPQ